MRCQRVFVSASRQLSEQASAGQGRF